MLPIVTGFPACGSSDPHANRDQDGAAGGASVGAAGSAGAPETEVGGGGAASGGNDQNDGGTRDLLGGETGDGGNEPTPDTAPPEVLSISPDDGSEDVDRETAISIVLSEPPDPTSVGAALAIRGPDGQIPGEISVNDDAITFTPDAPLLLLGEYVVTLEGIKDLAGNRQNRTQSAQFRATDGVFGEPEYPLGEEEPRAMRAFAANHSGDVLVGGTDGSTPPRAWASVYQRATNAFAPIQIIAESDTLTAYVRGADLNEKGAGSVAWWLGSPTSPGGWFGYTPMAGFEGASALTETRAELTAIAENGRAIAVTQDASRSVYYTIRDTKTGDVGPRLERGDTDETLHRFFGAGDDLVLIATRATGDGSDPGYELSATRYDASLVTSGAVATDAWQSAEVIRTSSVEPLDIIAVRDERFDIAVLWNEGDALWSASYSRADSAWNDPELVTEQPSAHWNTAAMSNGRAVATFSSLSGVSAAYYDMVTGWPDGSMLSLGMFDPAAVAIDQRGNALVLWNSSGDYRRYVSGSGPGAGWQPERSLALDLGNSHFEACAANDGRIAVFTSDKRTPAHELPVLIRFE